MVLLVKNPPANTEDAGDVGLTPGQGRFPWRRKWQPTAVFLPRESLGQESLVQRHKELDTIEVTQHAHIDTHARIDMTIYIVIHVYDT